MTLEVQVLTSRKGSNPGGVCNIITPKRVVPSYVKYCPGSHLPRRSHLNATNQPVYEVITNTLARSVGLNTTRTHILIDTEQNVRFAKFDGSKEGFGEGRRYYFVSELLQAQESENTELLSRIVHREKPYLDLLGICDVFDRRDNFFFYEDGEGKIVYVDLGCNFVRAKEGWIEIKNRDKKETRNRNHIKTARKDISHYSVIHAQEGYKVSFARLVDSIPRIRIPTLNPDGNIAVSELLSLEEVSEIRDILTIEMDIELRKHRKTYPQLVVRN